MSLHLILQWQIFKPLRSWDSYTVTCLWFFSSVMTFPALVFCNVSPHLRDKIYFELAPEHPFTNWSFYERCYFLGSLCKGKRLCTLQRNSPSELWSLYCLVCFSNSSACEPIFSFLHIMQSLEWIHHIFMKLAYQEEELWCLFHNRKQYK